MESIKIEGHVDDAHRLSADVPGSVPPGPVIVWITPTQQDDSEAHWMSGVVQEWTDELSDDRQDIYTLEDGMPLDEA